MNEKYQLGDIVLGNWKLVRLLGEGSFGKVYEVQRDDFGVSYKAAIKIITIPQNEGEIKNARAEGMDDESVTSYFKGVVEDLVQEFSLMSRLKGTANVVSYEDHEVVPHENSFGWDILIRMELLTPLIDYLNSNSLTQKDVIKLGIDLCRALELCQKFNIIHRDIKPENIFISDLGDYKLGDFGIARTVEKTMSGLSKKGTYTYMAPEVYRDEAYGPGVDMYSLGIVLYRLLNDNRAPFLPAYPKPISFSDRDTALTKRISGEPLPAPQNADESLAGIVLKACAYNPKDRYSSPALMRQDLESVLNSGKAAGSILRNDAAEAKPVKGIQGGEQVASDPETSKTESAFGAKASESGNPAGEPAYDELTAEHTESAFSAARSQTSRKYENNVKDSAGKQGSSKKIAVIAAVAAVIVLIGGILVFSKSGTKDTANTPDTDDPGTLNGSVPAEGNGSDDDEVELIFDGETFDSMIWGVYVIETGDGDPYGTDLTPYIDQFKYHMVDHDGEEYELSTLPVKMTAGAEAYNHFDMTIGKINKEYFERNNLIELMFFDKRGNKYTAYKSYEISGNTLSLYDFTNSIDEEAAASEEALNKYNAMAAESPEEFFDLYCNAHQLTEKWADYKFAFDGRDIILQYQGSEMRMVPLWFNNYMRYTYMSGYLSTDSQPYHDIAYISYSLDNDEAPSKGHYFVKFTDGQYAIDPVIELSETDNTMIIKWEERWSEYNHKTERVSDPTELVVEYIYCDYSGFIIIADGQYYRYQATEDQYYNARLGDTLEDVDTSNLEEEQLDELVQTQSSILNDLQDSFDSAGINAAIDDTTGRVTMDASILFAVDDSQLSDAGKAYLDGFLDAYAAVILNTAYQGRITQVVAEGHTDTNGGYEYNQTLSEKRAASVAEYCLSRQPELAQIMTTKGCSYDNPIYNEDGTVNMDASRRVVFKLILNIDG